MVIENSFFRLQGVPRRTKEERINAYKNKIITVTEDFKNYGYDYFDNVNIAGGYEGYYYDGRYEKSVKRIIEYYGLKPGDRILEVACAKGFVLIEFQKLGFEVYGIDKSQYAVDNCHSDISEFVQVGDAIDLPFRDNYFSLVIMKDALPNMPRNNFARIINECNRVTFGSLYIDIQCISSESESGNFFKNDSNQQVAEKKEWWELFFSNLNVEVDRSYWEIF
jgi:SAM-dependent methyltransferase